MIPNIPWLLSSLLLITLPLTADPEDPPAEKKAPVPLPRAHAHNDYLHPRPLLDALDQGFTSVEADIFLVKGELLVAHTRRELEEGRTLRKLYLDPLARRVKENGGQVHRGARHFQLLVDIKSDAESTYLALREVLEEYRSMLTRVEKGKHVPGAVTVVLSGNRPWELVEKQEVRLVGVDGRPGDLVSDRPHHLMPLVSERWGKLFRWRGEGPFPTDEREKLEAILEKAHAKKRRVRFWATPELPRVWEVLVEAGVDHVNTDQLVKLRKFLLARKKAEPESP